MSRRKLSGFIDALAAGRRPKGFKGDPQDAELIHTAITLRGARPGEDAPSAAFVERLAEQLADSHKPEPQPEPRRDAHPLRSLRARTVSLVAAGAVVLVSGTAVATEALTSSPGPAIALQVPHGSALRTGTFQAAGGSGASVVGQIVAFHGQHSWVFMNVGLPHYDGRVTCMLQVADGTTVAFGSFRVHDGIGQFSKGIDGVNVAELRGAKLVTDGGKTLALATFAA
jgi:hypothetical protein